jgi:hypothetical protein
LHNLGFILSANSIFPHRVFAHSYICSLVEVTP